MDPRFKGDWNPDKGARSIQFSGKWNGLDLCVTLINHSPDHFQISIESPFFNVKREVVKKDVLVEMDKVYAFLKWQPDLSQLEAKT